MDRPCPLQRLPVRHESGAFDLEAAIGVYAGGANRRIHRLDPSNLSGGPLDSYDDENWIEAIAYGDDGNVYAGGFNDKVNRLDPSDLSGGPLDSYDDGTNILEITYGDDGYVYAGGNNNKVHRLDPGVSLSVSSGEDWESVV